MSSENYETNPAEVIPPDRDPRGGNAQRHGILSEHVPPAEREAYAAHVRAVRQSSGARGYLQERLADRIALAMWRLDRVARYEAAVSAAEQRSALQGIEEQKEYGPAGMVTKAYTRLHMMVGESAAHLRKDPALSEDQAARHEEAARQLDALADGGSGEGLEVNAAFMVADLLTEHLQRLKVKPAAIVQALTGRKPKAGEVEYIEANDWEYEPEELPGLVRLWRTRLDDHMSGALLRSLAGGERLKAQAVRDAQREAGEVHTDALSLAALPGPKELEKVTRYEAHLERVLYRALHELEAVQRRGEGQDTPGPLRGIVDAGGLYGGGGE